MSQTAEIIYDNAMQIKYEHYQKKTYDTPEAIMAKSLRAGRMNLDSVYEKSVRMAKSLNPYNEIYYDLARNINDFYQNKLSKNYQIKTISDLFAVNYPLLLSDLAMQHWDTFGKAAFLSTDTGAYSAVHGFEAIEQIIQEANMFSMLPKGVYSLGGFKAITAAGATSGGGVAENASIPTTIKPSLVNVPVAIKEFAIAFETSMRERFLSTTPNDVWNRYNGQGGNAMDALRAYFNVEAAKLINRQLLQDNDTLAGNNFESIDRVVGSYSEISGVGQTAGDLDIYGIDRDAAASWADAYVNHNSGTDREITISLIKDLIEKTQPYWRNQSKQNKFFVTGYDTLNDIEKMFESQMMYSKNFNGAGAKVRPSINGVQTLSPGADVGLSVATVYDIPVLVTDDVPKDGKSRLYLLDFDHIKFAFGVPMQYQEGGFSKGTALELGSLGDKGLYYMSGELWADKFKCHAKLRDLA